jgi:hypothetical protein
LLRLDGEARVESVRAAIAKSRFEAAKNQSDLQKLLQPTP